MADWTSTMADYGHSFENHTSILSLVFCRIPSKDTASPAPFVKKPLQTVLARWVLSLDKCINLAVNKNRGSMHKCAHSYNYTIARTFPFCGFSFFFVQSIENVNK